LDGEPGQPACLDRFSLNVELTTVARAFDEVRCRDLVDGWIGVAPLEIWGKAAILRRLRTVRALDRIKGWALDNPKTASIAKHALRSLFRRGFLGMG
jgi:hypothetical protein